MIKKSYVKEKIYSKLIKDALQQLKEILHPNILLTSYKYFNYKILS